MIAALLCLTIAKVNGTAGLGPIAAIGIFCAALSMLTLLPAMLTIFGRRAFWPYVPHTPETAPSANEISARAQRDCVEGSTLRSLLQVIGACLLVVVLLPLVLINWLLKVISRGRIPSLIVGPLDRAVFKPYEVRRYQREASGRRHPRLLETGRRPRREKPAAGHRRSRWSSCSSSAAASPSSRPN